MSRSLVGGAALLLAVLALTSSATGAPARPPRDPALEASYARDLQARDPALAAAFHAGTRAMDAGKLDEARAAFDRIRESVPEHGPTLRRAGYLELKAGRVDSAIALARRALEAAPGREGKAALASALAEKKLDFAARSEAVELAGQLLDGDPDAEYATIAAGVAMTCQHVRTLGRAVEALERLAPDGLATAYLGAVYYGASDQYAKADEALRRAQRAGLPAAEAARFREETGLGRRLLFRRLAVGAAVAFGAWALGLFAIFLTGLVLSRATVAAIERWASDPSDALVTNTRALRRAYKGGVGLAAIYYFVSIPMVVLIVAFLAGLALYGILALGYIPFKLVALIVIGALISIWALLRSLIVRRGQEEDPGVPLPEAEAPGLWRLLREVAGRVGTRPVDSVFLTPGTDVAVSERGRLRARLADRGHRFLVLGVGVLPGLSQRQLGAILAHEYGHFSNRDTAGGDVAGAVLASLVTAVIGIARGGSANVFNPAWHFLRVFLSLFQRITLGAKRLQEVLADRFAIRSYGARSFSEGLRHVVDRTIRFGRDSDQLVAHAQQTGLAIANLYASPATPAPGLPDIDKAIAEAVNEPGSPYDSHPPVAMRLLWAAALGTEEGDPGPDAAAWDLFADRAALEARMTKLVNEHLQRGGAIERPTPPAPTPAA